MMTMTMVTVISPWSCLLELRLVGLLGWGLEGAFGGDATEMLLAVVWRRCAPFERNEEQF